MPFSNGVKEAASCNFPFQLLNCSRHIEGDIFKENSSRESARLVNLPAPARVLKPKCRLSLNDH
jgi:hypothetical protein